jgi:Ca-activated chloride channel homolog
MQPAVTASRPLRRRTLALVATSAAVAGAAALLTVRAPAGGVLAGDCDGEAIERVAGMQLAVRARTCAILRGATETHVAVEITAPDTRRTTTREPVALALVLDRSGSMVGQPLRDAKAAALRALDALEPGDVFSLVTYSSRASLAIEATHASDEHKARARALIEEIRASGGTNLSAGLELGAGSLACSGASSGWAAPPDGDWCADGAAGHVRRVVLVSDGEPNEGIHDRGGLAALASRTAERGVSISTIGVGLDFNERIMTDIAVAGRGNYWFVERTADLVTIFDRELGSIGATVAAGARLLVTPAAGVEVVEAYGYRTERQSDGVLVPIADLRAGETRKVVLRVRVQSEAPGARDLLAARLTWRPVGATREETLAAAVRVDVTDDAAAVGASTLIAADRQVLEATTAAAIEEASEAFEAGDVARARQILHVQAETAAAAPAARADKVLEGKIRGATEKADGYFKKAPATTGGTQKALKASRKDAHDLAR